MLSKEALAGKGVWPITVCRHCKHFIGLEPDAPRKDVWYNHLCKAWPRPVAIDPYDGKLKPLDGKNYAEHFYDYCRDHNGGNCSCFEEVQHVQS